MVVRAGRGLNGYPAIESVVTSICEEQINASKGSIYNIAALCLNDLEARQLLACSGR